MGVHFTSRGLPTLGVKPWELLVSQLKAKYQVMQIEGSSAS